jgi:DNA polymerase I
MAAPFGADLWAIDAEWGADAGCLPKPRLFCAVQHGTGHPIRLGEKELPAYRGKPPFPITDNTIITSYSLAADMVFWRVMRWPIPRNKVCTFATHITQTNGLSTGFGDDLVGAAATVGVPYFHAGEKKRLRDRFADLTPLTAAEEKEGMEYCEDDAVTCLRILEHYLPDLWWDQALLYGDYADACAQIEYTGIPIDVDRFALFQRHRETARRRMIAVLDKDYRIFDEKGHERRKLIREFIDRQKDPPIPWPLSPNTGAPILDKDILKGLATRFPVVEGFLQLRKTNSSLRSNKFGIDNDGRCHTGLVPFGTKTGRNAPKGRFFPFSFPAWMRGMIAPHPGQAIGYLDYSCEEFAIAAWLSGDRNMQAVYLSGDPYLAMGILLGLAPRGATKRTHKAVRDLCKVLVLAISYGMGKKGLAQLAGVSEDTADDYLKGCKRAFPVFHEWANDQVARAQALGHITTDFGWTLQVERNASPRSLRNFMMQATGSDILRLDALALINKGIQVDALIHDAALVESSIADFGDCVRESSAIMQRVSEQVIGFPLRVDTGDETEPHLFRYPQRFRDKREGKMYREVFTLLAQLDAEANGLGLGDVA